MKIAASYLLADSANNDSYLPPEFSDKAFLGWAFRVNVKLLNLPPTAPEHVMRRALFSDGIPCDSWRQAYEFMVRLHLDKRGTHWS